MCGECRGAAARSPPAAALWLARFHKQPFGDRRPHQRRRARRRNHCDIAERRARDRRRSLWPAERMPAIGFDTADIGFGTARYLVIERVCDVIKPTASISVARARSRPPASQCSNDTLLKIGDPTREVSHKLAALARCAGNGRGASRRPVGARGSDYPRHEPNWGQYAPPGSREGGRVFACLMRRSRRIAVLSQRETVPEGR